MELGRLPLWGWFFYHLPKSVHCSLLQLISIIFSHSSGIRWSLRWWFLISWSFSFFSCSSCTWAEYAPLSVNAKLVWTYWEQPLPNFTQVSPKRGSALWKGVEEDSATLTDRRGLSLWCNLGFSSRTPPCWSECSIAMSLEGRADCHSHKWGCFRGRGWTGKSRNASSRWEMKKELCFWSCWKSWCRASLKDWTILRYCFLLGPTYHVAGCFWARL